MKPRVLFLAILAAFFVSQTQAEEVSGIIISIERSLPGDCAIVATEAYHRVAASASWARLLHIQFYEAGSLTGHMMCVWQVAPKDPILIYDAFFLEGKTLELATRNRNADAIIKAFSTVQKVTISEGHFVK